MVRFRLAPKDRSVQRRLVVPALLLVAFASGCKSSSWMARPTWLGGSPPTSSLSSAPAFDKGIAKPSETAKPYPTTTTPEGYVLNNQTRTDATKPTVSSTPTAVTYGATPPPSTATASAPAIAPQVGPYASLQQAPATASNDPAAAVTSGFAAAPAFGGMTQSPAQATPPAGARFADASGSTAGWNPTPPSQPAAAPSTPSTAAVLPAAQPTPVDARYGAATGSRFSTGSQPPAAATPVGEPPAPWSPPPADAVPPAVPPASAAPETALPGAMTPPTRRPDPGYRPGGTSSYRPAKTLLAGDDEEGGVQPASFAAPE